MAEFQFQSGVKTLDIKNASGEVVKTLSINVGQKENTKKWIKEINAIQEVSANLSENESVMDELEALEKGIITTILGSETWDMLWELCDHNVLSMLGFIKYLSGFLNECMKGFYRDYV